MRNKDFVVFIISHGRADSIVTYKTLKKRNYTGRVYIIIDNLDTTRNQYENIFGKENIIIFNKEEIAKTTDNGDNFSNLRTTTHVRNACFNIARDLGFTYFLVLDDDYINFCFRLNDKLEYPAGRFIIKNIDYIFDAYLDFYKSINALSICMSQGGDYIGGKDNKYAIEQGMTRKAMNSFFCSTERPFKFVSRLNEDVNTYMTLGSRGELFATIPFCSVTQIESQTLSGGMTESYLAGGTFIKSFYTVMYCPSFATVSMMSNRMHHRIEWGCAVPCILDEKYKKQL